MVRNIDEDVWRALRMEAVRQGISVAQLIENLWGHTQLSQERARWPKAAGKN